MTAPSHRLVQLAAIMLVAASCAEEPHTCDPVLRGTFSDWFFVALDNGVLMANALVSGDWGIQDNDPTFYPEPARVPWIILAGEPAAIALRFDTRTVACGEPGFQVAETAPPHTVLSLERHESPRFGSTSSALTPVTDVLIQWTPEDAGLFQFPISWGPYQKTLNVQVSNQFNDNPVVVLPQGCYRTQAIGDGSWLCDYDLFRDGGVVFRWNRYGTLQVLHDDTVAEWYDNHLNLWTFDGGAPFIRTSIEIGASPELRWDGGGRWAQDDMYLLPDGGLLLDGNGLVFTVADLDMTPSVTRHDWPGQMFATKYGVLSTQKIASSTYRVCKHDSDFRDQYCIDANGFPAAAGHDGLWMKGAENELYLVYPEDGGFSFKDLLIAESGSLLPGINAETANAQYISDAGQFSRPRHPGMITGRDGCIVFERNTIITANVFAPITGWTQEYRKWGSGGDHDGNWTWCVSPPPSTTAIYWTPEPAL